MRLVPLDAAWPPATLRGSATLSALLTSTAGVPAAMSLAVTRVWVVPGHIFVAMRQSTTLAAFDVVPAALSPGGGSGSGGGSSGSSAGGAGGAGGGGGGGGAAAILSERLQNSLTQLLLGPTAISDNTPLVDNLGSVLLLSANQAPVIQVIVGPNAIPEHVNNASNSNVSGQPANTIASTSSSAAASGSGGAGGNIHAWVIRENGTIEGWRFTRRRSAWTRTVRDRVPIEITPNLCVGDALLERSGVGDAAVFVYTETYTDKRGLDVCDVSVIPLLVQEDESEQLTLSWASIALRTLLRGVPLVKLLSIDGGLALMPLTCAPLDGRQLHATTSPALSSSPASSTSSTTSAPVGLTEDMCYFWAHENNGPVQSMVWGLISTGQTTPPNEPVGLYRIAAYTVHPVTRELLVLDTSMNVTVCAFVGNTIQCRILVRLSSAAQQQGPTGSVRLLYHRLSLIVIDATASYIFALTSGLLQSVVPHPDEIKHSVPEVWSSPGPAGQIGLWSSHGMWQFQHRRVADLLAAKHPKYSATSQQGLATDPAELWSLPRLQTRRVLDAAYVLHAIEGTPTTSSPENEAAIKAARTLLQRELVQSPALVVALLDNFPAQRQYLRSHLSLFLDDFLGKPIEPKADGEEKKYDLPPRVLALANGLEAMNGAYRAFRVQTPLTRQLKPIVEQYLSLLDGHEEEALPVVITAVSEALSSSSLAREEAPTGAANRLDNVVIGSQSSSQSTPMSVSAPSTTQSASGIETLNILRNDLVAELSAILERAASRFRSSKTPIEVYEDRARFETLVLNAPELVLAELIKFLNLGDLDEATLPEGDELAMLEYFFKEESLQEVTASGRGTRSPRLLLFEALASLMVRHQPENLGKLISYAHAAVMKSLSIRTKAGNTRNTNNTRLWRRDSSRVMDTFKQRTMQAVMPSTPVAVFSWPQTDASIKAITCLLVGLEESPSAVRFLMSLRRWDEAITLVQEVSSSNDIVLQVELFHTVFTTVLESNQSNRAILDRLWDVVPRNYSIYDLLGLLKTVDSSCNNTDILVTDPCVLTVGAVRAHLLQLMQRETRKR